MSIQIPKVFLLPHIRGQMDLDSAGLIKVHAQIIKEKAPLKSIYEECYLFFKQETLNSPPGIKLELGSGGGFIKEVMPDTITSDVVPGPGIDMTLSALDLPFAENSLSTIYLLNVFHHIENIEQFLNEAQRCLIPGGKILMIEPANTIWSRFIYRYFHHEEFNPSQTSWNLPPGGRLSQANGALPWIVFCRDRKILSEKYPSLEVLKYENFLPFRYLLSGGLSVRNILPNPIFYLVKALEQALHPLARYLGMFVVVSVVHRG